MSTGKTIVMYANVTPDMAREWLVSASQNRSIAKSVVNKYAKDMASRRWEVNGETIKFNGGLGDRLIDGRHRLSACVESNVPFGTFIALYIQEFKSIDTQRKRTIADAVNIFGDSEHIPFGLALDGTINLLIGYARRSRSCQNGSHILGTMSHTEKVNWLLQNEQLSQILPQAKEYLVQRTPLRPSTAIALFFMATLAGHSVDIIHDFLRGVRDGNDLYRNSPALSYRNFLLNARARNRSVSAREAFLVGISSLNHHLAGKPLQVCKVSLGITLAGLTPDELAQVLGISADKSEVGDHEMAVAS